jgi:hypothetical protein
VEAWCIRLGALEFTPRLGISFGAHRAGLRGRHKS